jgi:hypothetical protein
MSAPGQGQGTRVLTLTRDEVMVLTDRVQNTDWGTDDMRVISYRLLIKLGSLYVEIVDPAQSDATAHGDMRVTEAEAWLLRSKVQSSDKMSSDAMFGVKLLRKLYQLLLEFEADVQFKVVDFEGPAMNNVRAQLNVWKQKEEDDGREKQPA